MTGRGPTGRLDLGRLRPRSIQARVALAIAVALLVVFVVAQLVLVAFVEARSRSELEAALQQQATSIARALDGRSNVPAAARDAQQYVGTATRMVVSVQGEVVHWNVPVDRLEASATGSSGDVTVLLQRRDPGAGLFTDWQFVALLAIGLVGTGVLIWYLASGVGARLRAGVDALADSAQAVAEGRLDVRAPEPDDELGRLARAFNRMTARLEQADARQREFLADVAHELRTPVTSIEGFAQALGDGTARTEEDRREAIAFIREEAARLRELVHDLQQLTYLDLQPEVRSEPLDMGDAARRAAARLALDAHVKGVALAATGDAAAVGDPEHVDTILTNLVANALRATSAGGAVTLTAVAGSGEAGVAVRDTGTGIAPEHLPHIFDRLYRVQAGRERAAGGSGLGLSIVRRLATLLGGRVTVESIVGEGSTFTLWLPASAVAPPPPSRVGSGPV
ncbi:MAG TPA: HAMP domain-containing sensor histidine kinase [Miltoncostaea sp.]|nr:HAMP domain-containing sensor histidine kinase [Miltoncostaea sp.]